MDAVWLAVGSVVVAIVTTLGGVKVASIQSRREEGGVVEVLRERMALKDEQIEDCNADREELRARLARAEGQRA